VVTISDDVPPWLTNPQYSINGGANWAPWTSPYVLGSLNAGASAVVLLHGTPDCSAIGTVSNTATVALSPIVDTYLTNNTSTASTTISDKTDPTFTLPILATGYCVEAITQAVFNKTPTDPDVDDLTYLRPDYYLFGAGFTILNLSNILDNCGLPANPISWTIDFGNNGSVELLGTGQISTYGSAIQFPVGTNRITYTVIDSAGNQSVQHVDLVVTPRPTLTKTL